MSDDEEPMWSDASDINLRIAAAERRGYDRAVANLRQLAENTTGTFRQVYRNGADWLEEHATKETTL